MEMKYKMAIVIRNDLKMSKGKLAVQVAHASVSCAIEPYSDHSVMEEWFDEGQRKVCLKVESLQELEAVEQLAIHNGVLCKKIVDFGLTELPPNTVTCIGIGPALEEKINKVTGNLKLV